MSQHPTEKSRWAYLPWPDQALDRKMEANLKSTKNPSRVIGGAAVAAMMVAESKLLSLWRNYWISTGLLKLMST